MNKPTISEGVFVALLIAILTTVAYCNPAPQPTPPPTTVIETNE